MREKVFGFINLLLIVFAVIINFNLRLDYHYCPDTLTQELEICKDDNDFHNEDNCHLCSFHNFDKEQDCDCQKKEIAIYFSIPATLSDLDISFLTDFVCIFNFESIESLFLRENNQNKNHFFDFQKNSLIIEDICIQNQVFRI